MTEKRVVPVAGVFAYETFGFTTCVAHDGLLLLSGISALDSAGNVVGESIEEQTSGTFDNIEAVLRAAGSDLGQLLQLTSFVVDLPRHGSRYVEARRRRLPDASYTSATVGVAALMVPGLLLEVQAIAAG